MDLKQTWSNIKCGWRYHVSLMLHITEGGFHLEMVIVVPPLKMIEFLFAGKEPALHLYSVL